MVNILITGASRGIGKACAIRFAKAYEDADTKRNADENMGVNMNANVDANIEGGCHLYLVCHTRIDELNELAAQISSDKVKCTCFAGDVGDYNFCKEVMDKIYKDTANRGLDILVNNAGVSHIGLLQDMNIEDWNKVINTNLSSVFSFSSLAIPGMIKNGHGKIVNVSSVWGNVGASCEVAYSASKGGINSFTKALAKELAPSNIQVNAIAFGAIATEMNNFLSEDEANALIDEIPAGRMGTVEEAAESIYQIATACDYMTGQIVTVDGGWM